MKTFRCYQLTTDWPDSEDQLHEVLLNQEFQPCGPFTERSMGFEPVVEGGLLCRRLLGADLLKLRVQSRVLPPAAVKEALNERIADYISRTGQEPSRKDKRNLKEEVYAEMLPKSHTKSDYIFGFCIQELKIFVVGTGAEGNAELFLDCLRACLGILPCYPMAFKNPADQFFKRMLFEQGPLDLGNEVQLQDDDQSVVSFKDYDLRDDTVSTLLENGLLPKRLGLIAPSREFRFTLDTNLVFRKFVFTTEELIDDSDEDPVARLDADFVIFLGHVKALLGVLGAEMGGFSSG
jgi:recombination associated protein RdgC